MSAIAPDKQEIIKELYSRRETLAADKRAIVEELAARAGIATSHGASGSWEAPAGAANAEYERKHPYLTAPIRAINRMGEVATETTKGMASGLYHAATDPISEEEKKAQGPYPFAPTVLARRLIGGEQGIQESKDLAALSLGELKKGNIGQAFGRGVQSIPIVGPALTSLSEKLEKGDISGAIGEGLTFYAAPKIAKEVPTISKSIINAPRTAADFLRNRISPEARMAAAEATRANITKSLAIPASTNTMALVKTGLNLARRASIPINETLANFAANGRPFGQNARIPITGEMAGSETSAGAARTGPSSETLANRLFREKIRSENVAAIDRRTLYGPESQARPAGVFPEEQPFVREAKSESAKLNIERPSAATALRQALEEATPPTPPAVLDAPSINKWIGAKSSQMMRGADPGARLLSEKLIGADKTATAANVKSALSTAGTDLAKILEEADASGKTINAKTIIDTAIADATKKFGIKSDEAFMKQIEQISTDAFSEFPDLTELTPSRAHELKVRMGNSTRFDVSSATQTEVNALLKKVYGELNDQLKATAEGIGPAQTRWGDLYQASKALKESLTKDRAGRGSGSLVPEPKPIGTAADRLRSRMNPNP